MSRIVIWPGCGGPLLLQYVVRNADGSVKSGEVANGAWRFEIRGNECLAKGDRNCIVNRWPKPDTMRVVEVPAGKRGDYNSIIAWAEAVRDEEDREATYGDDPEWQETQAIQAGDKQP